MSGDKLCYWCHEVLPPLAEDASYVDEINHYIHAACRDERDTKNRRMEELRARIVEGTIDSIPDHVRQTVLDCINRRGSHAGAGVSMTPSTASKVMGRIRIQMMMTMSMTTTNATA